MEKLDGVLTLYSNSPGSVSGYGQQADHLVSNLKRSGLEVAVSSNNHSFDNENAIIETSYGDVAHFSGSMQKYSVDVAPGNHKKFISRFPGKTNRLLTLYDVWVLNNPEFDELDIMSWVPIDHISMPPAVYSWLSKPNVLPIAMAPNGVRQMQENGIECEYAPHAIDIDIFKPTYEIRGIPIEEHMKSKDKFVVGMMAANAPLGMMHRKAYGENILAFSIFQKRHPDAMLYVHTKATADASGIGWNLPVLMESCGINLETVLFPNAEDYNGWNITQNDLAGYYTGMDVFLAPSYGEGFGLGTIEAQACGTRVIGSNWAATPDLVADDGWLVDGQPIWNPMTSSWFKAPNVLTIVAALENAYQAGKGRSQIAIDFASQFDIEKVWQENWMPILKKIF
jgi:glycosyltransferase involved in cell wall biosynthesis